MKNKIAFFSIFLVFVMVSCQKTIETDGQKDIRNLNISDNFNFATIHDLEVKVTLLDGQNLPVGNCRIDFYDGSGTNDPNSSIESKGKTLFTGVTNSQGVFEGLFPVPSALSEIVVSPAMVGYATANKIPVVNGKLTTTLGGPSQNKKSTETPSMLKSASTVGYSYLGTWNNSGVPNYLTQPGDVITASFMSNIHASLPEYIPLTTSHPEYLESTAEGNIVLNASCDVWLTFVHEGAGWLNSLGFYTYNQSSPPTSAADITNKTIIFPNCSFGGSGGGLFSGDKVYLGQFSAGTVIGWFLVASAWSSTNHSVGNGTHTLYSNQALNPETNVNLKKHQVLLYDATTSRMVVAFEDMRRDNGADNDFNDAIFFATANPITSVATNQVRALDTPTDNDNDGVPDVADDYPNDGTRAFNNYFPGEGQFGTLAFEDLWPDQGDYDFNDLVLSYNYNQVTNAQNNVVEIYSNMKVRAIGASFHNGFGTMFGVLPSAIASTSGSVLNHGIVTLAANGVEAGTTKAVSILFDDAYDILQYPGVGIGINTTPSAPYVEPEILSQHIVFTSPVTPATLGTPPYNPFIFVGGDRGKEIHMPDYAPTSKVNSSFFGTNGDDSNPANGRYYKTSQNLPWAINLPVEWEYPIEKSPVNQAYLKFNPWAESAGVNENLWYSNLGPVYRNTSLIY